MEIVYTLTHIDVGLAYLFIKIIQHIVCYKLLKAWPNNKTHYSAVHVPTVIFYYILLNFIQTRIVWCLKKLLIAALKIFNWIQRTVSFDQWFILRKSIAFSRILFFSLLLYIKLFFQILNVFIDIPTLILECK